MGFQVSREEYKIVFPRVSVQGVKTPCGYFECLYWGFDFYEVKKNIIFQKEKGNTFTHFYSEKSSKRTKEHKSTTMNPNLPE